MKKLLSTLVLSLFVLVAFGQKKEPEATCFTKYAKVFEQRGACEVNDSTYEDVVITIRKGTMADCFYGKVIVKNGVIDINSLALRFEDNTYEKLDVTFKYHKKPKVETSLSDKTYASFSMKDPSGNILKFISFSSG